MFTNNPTRFTFTSYDFPCGCGGLPISRSDEAFRVQAWDVRTSEVCFEISANFNQLSAFHHLTIQMRSSIGNNKFVIVIRIADACDRQLMSQYGIHLKSAGNKCV